MLQYLSLEEVNRRAEALRGPFARVETAEVMLGVPAAREGAATCSPIVVRVSHMASLDSDKQRPQTFISGEIHGDEKIVRQTLHADMSN